MDSNIARLLENTNISGQNSKIDMPYRDSFLQKQIIENFSGPALLVDETMQVVHQNIYADGLVHSIKNKNPAIHGIIIRCINNNCPDNQKITIDDENGTRYYDLFAFPVNLENTNKGSRVLLFGKDTTVEQHLTKALVDSRQMFKDFVSCSTDFAWETDNKGRFKYVSPNGILGYTAYELNDKNAAELIVGDDGLNPFDTLDAINDVEIWLQRSDASFACVQVSAIPIIDSNSTWQGARGVCRDITDIRERESSLRRIRKSDQLLRKIISTIRDETDHSKILSTTAMAALEGITAKQCYITEISQDKNFKTIIKLKTQCGELNDDKLFNKVNTLILSVCEKSTNRLPPSFMEEEIDGQIMLIGFSKHHNKLNGAIIVALDQEKKSWDKDEKTLFMGITSHLGIALEQIKNYETLEKLSHTDELTSLLNRRAFSNKVNKRLVTQQRQKQNCALLFIDIDNFKQVNDVYGHAKGDEILQKLASILNNSTREEDFCCRLGGDEFAVWLEDIDKEDAILKARNILDNTHELRSLAHNHQSPVSLSIGIAMSNPDMSHSLDSLMELADKALYNVKKNGKSDILLDQ